MEIGKIKNSDDDTDHDTVLFDSALAFKNAGNQAFVAKQFHEALGHYSQGIACLQSGGITAQSLSKSNNNDDGDRAAEQDKQSGDNHLQTKKKQFIDLLTTLHSNSAQCYLDLGHFQMVVQQGAAALQVSPLHGKSMFRVVTAISKMEENYYTKDLWYKGLLVCERGLKKAEPPETRESFRSLYKNTFTRPECVAMTSCLTLGAAHWANCPVPFLCMICRAPPDFSPVKGTGSSCECGSASFCCDAHRELAFSPTGGHKPVCEMLKNAKKTLSGEGVDLMDILKDQQKKNKQEGGDNNNTFDDEDPRSTMKFLRGLQAMFLAAKRGQPQSPLEYEQLRNIQVCGRCGNYPAENICKDCHTVAFCRDTAGCERRQGKVKRLLEEQKKEGFADYFEGTHHLQSKDSSELCRAFSRTAQAVHKFWLEPRYSYAFGVAVANKETGCLQGAVAESGDSRKEVRGILHSRMILKSSSDHLANRFLPETFASDLTSSPSVVNRWQLLVSAMEDKPSDLVAISKHLTELSHQAHLLYRSEIAPLFIRAFPQQEEGAEEGEEQQPQEIVKASMSFSAAAVESLQGHFQLLQDSFSWPLSVFYGAMSAPRAAIDALKSRLQQQHTEEGIDDSSAAVAGASGQLVLHVVGAELESHVSEAVWEELLHRFSSWKYGKGEEEEESHPSCLVQHLDVVFIGPQVQCQGADKKVVSVEGGNTSSSPTTTTMREELCDICEANGFSVSLHFSKRTYEEFVEIEVPKLMMADNGDDSVGASERGSEKQKKQKKRSGLASPHMRVLFNAGLYNYTSKERGQFDGAGMWTEALKCFYPSLDDKKSELHPHRSPPAACISIITEYDVDEARWDREIVRKLFSTPNPNIDAECKVKGETKVMNNNDDRSEKNEEDDSLLARGPAVIVGPVLPNPLCSPLAKPDPTHWDGRVIVPSSFFFTLSQW